MRSMITITLAVLLGLCLAATLLAGQSQSKPMVAVIYDQSGNVIKATPADDRCKVVNVDKKDPTVWDYLKHLSQKSKRPLDISVENDLIFVSFNDDCVIVINNVPICICCSW